MAKTQRSKKEWIAIIQQCKSSGYSDVEWCKENGIAVSTFYRKLNLLRQEASINEIVKPVVQDRQEVVEVNVLTDRSPGLIQPSTNEVAIRLSINGVTIDILNTATKTTIETTLHALRFLC